ncbi:MAG: acyl-CoA dehydrogenase family protein [Dehalococcoidia bacterium]|jgi:alkylation response protein AidB-like acyl-CoA dehydrogenase
MDLGLSEEQELLKNFARDFLEKECTENLVREMEEDEKGYSPQLWKGMADQGWCGLIVPPEQGGSGMGFMDLAVLTEEFGRALVPGPFLSTQVGGAIPLLGWGTDAQKQAHLAKIASGDEMWTLAVTEPVARFDADGVQMEAKVEGDKLVLNGTKLFVRDANVADFMTVAVRTKAGGEDGITLVIVDAKSAGISTTQLKTIGSDKQCEVKFQNVAVPKSNVIGEIDKGWPILKQLLLKAATLEAAYLIGLAQADFEITVNYAKERVQFGRPIGSFQAIQHKCADMVTDADSARFLVYRAAWAVAEGEPDAEQAVHMAKAWANDASRRLVANGQQIHGGIGFTKDYKIQLYFRRQKMADLMWGDADFHREMVAQSLGM